jgi:hypothetical protein
MQDRPRNLGGNINPVRCLDVAGRDDGLHEVCAQYQLDRRLRPKPPSNANHGQHCKPAQGGKQWPHTHTPWSLLGCADTR